MKLVEYTVNVLKQIMYENGPGFIEDEPYEVYKKILKSKCADKKTAGAILCFLVNGMLNKIDDNTVHDKLSESVQHDCGLNKEMSDVLSNIFLQMHAICNSDEHKDREYSGLAEFLKEDFSCVWEGFAVWDYGNGTLDCRYRAEIVLKPTAKVPKNNDLQKLLNKNPFIDKETVFKFFECRLSDYLDKIFEEDCTEDDYYPPVVEDFEIDYNVREWCKENGFEMVSCEGDGEAGEYEPKFRYRRF